jgi:TRAP-type C4-dicarboxylate transport system substrate-binding protein
METRIERRIMVSVILLLALVFLTYQGTTSAAEKPIELKFSHYMPVTFHEHINAFVPFAKDVELRTKGRVKITIFPSEALGKAKDQYDLAVQGITDIAFLTPSYTAGRFPLTGVMELPIQVPSGKVGTRVIWDLYGKYLKSEYKNVKVLSIWVNNPGHIFTAKTQVKTLDDLKGLRLRSPGPQQTNLLRELGGSPLTLPIPELYDALSRGMVDGVMTDFGAVKDFKLYEKLKYATISNLYVFPMALVMNQKVWDSLPPDIKIVFDELCGLRFGEINADTFDRNGIIGEDVSKKAGIEIIHLSPEQKKIWAERMKPLSEKWVAEMEAKGLPGKKIYEDTLMLLKKYSK